MYNPFVLFAKRILVTGASSGIGKAVAIACSRMGASVIICGRDEKRLKLTYSLLDKSEKKIHSIIVSDLSTDEGILEMVQQIDGIDGLAHCAGINDKSLIKFVDRDKVNRMFNINCFVPILLVKELVKQKKIKHASSLILLSSISSDYATISNSLYASSKGAVDSLIRTLALELSSKRIRVNGITPGMVNTEMINAYGLTHEELAGLAKSYPLGRFGEPDDIANVAIYLLSDASSWMTGTNIVIDGGITLR